MVFPAVPERPAEAAAGALAVECRDLTVRFMSERRPSLPWSGSR